MAEAIVAAYDGSAAARRAVDHALALAKARGAPLVVAHVLEWSPYSFLTPEEIAERHKRRSEEITRAQSAVLAPLVAELSGRGIEVETVIRYGHVAETLCEDRQRTRRGSDRDRADRVFNACLAHLRFGRWIARSDGTGALHHRALTQTGKIK